MSEICATVNPCSAAGRPTIGTSTRTTRAVRRAFQKPHAVTATPRIGTNAALKVCRDPSSACAVSLSTPTIELIALASHASTSTPSRSNVSTNSDENSPMKMSPSQVNATVTALL